MTIFDVDLAGTAVESAELDRYPGPVVPVVTVARGCGPTPQHAGPVSDAKHLSR
jgi:glutathione peroxidase-family protein